MRRSVERARRAAARKRNERARELLLAHLTEAQAKTYVDDGFFEVELPASRTPKPNGYAIKQRRYCLHRGRDSVIFALDDNGKHTRQMCTHIYGVHTLHAFGPDVTPPRDLPWPIDDAMLAHKLVLENDSQFLSNAAFCSCYPNGHQRPDLRGPYFDPIWTQQSLPSVDGEPEIPPIYPFAPVEPGLYRYRYEPVRVPFGLGPVGNFQLIVDEVEPLRPPPRRDVEGLAAFWHADDHAHLGMGDFWRNYGGAADPKPLAPYPEFDVRAMQAGFDALHDEAAAAWNDPAWRQDVANEVLGQVDVIEQKVLDIIDKMRELPREPVPLQIGEPPAPEREGGNFWDRHLHPLRVEQPDVAQEQRLKRFFR